VRSPDDPPDPIPDAAPDDPPEPLAPELTRFQVEAGIVSGNGLGNPRFGGEFGVWAPVYRRWVSHWSFGYAVQPRTSDGTGAAFALANASVGPRFMIHTTLIAPTVGIQAQMIEASLGEAELNRGQPAVGPLMSVHARLTQGRLAPFLNIRASYLPKTPVTVQSVDETGAPLDESLGQHGPWQVEALVGVSFAFSP
jgi:hypothetical protein